MFSTGSKIPLVSILSILFVMFLTVDLSAQADRTTLDDFFDSAESIVIAKCLKTGPVDILLRSRVELDVLQIVKGDPKMTMLSLKISFGMQPGRNYLVRIPKATDNKSQKSLSEDRYTVVPVSDHENLDLLKTLPPHIIVLRTLNMRIDELEYNIRSNTYELDGLKAIKKGN